MAQSRGAVAQSPLYVDPAALASLKVDGYTETDAIRALEQTKNLNDAREYLSKNAKKIEKPQHSSLKVFIAGGAAGAVSRTCTSPLERAKILLQLQTMRPDQPQKYTGVWNVLVTIYKEEGIRGYFKGNGVNVLRIAPYSAVQFVAYEKIKQMLAPGGAKDLTTLRRMSAGALSGIASVLATYPLDLIRTRLTAHNKAGEPPKKVWATTVSVIKNEGIFAVYKGVGTTLLGIAPYVAINFTVYEKLKSMLTDYDSPGVIPSLSCGAIAGATAQTFTYPIDLLRRRMQMVGADGMAIYKGPWDATKKIVEKEGILGLYRGMVPCYMKVIPAISISFCTYELMKSLLQIESKQIAAPQ